MARRRANPKDLWLPNRVYRGRSSYEFKPKGINRIIRLAPLNATPAEVLARYQEEHTKLYTKSGTVKHIIDEFFKSEAFLSLQPSSQKKYVQNSKKLLAAFGEMDADKVKPMHVRQYLDIRGQQAKVTANRELAFFRRVYSWAYERGKVEINPCKGVKSYSEQARDRYISDAEYAALLEISRIHYPAVFKAMEISYCCAARISDVLELKRSQISADGIYIKQGKTNKAQLKAWSQRLRRAIDFKINGISSTTYPVHNLKGQRILYDTFRMMWNAAKEKAQEEFKDLNFDFTFHDIKAKSISDVEGGTSEKQKFSGHKSAQMIGTYNRKIDVVKTHDFNESHKK